MTAVAPGVSIVDVPFDDYLCKPIDEMDLFVAVDQQREAASYDDALAEFFGLTAKLAVLKVEHALERPEGSGEYLRSGCSDGPRNSATN